MGHGAMAHGAWGNAAWGNAAWGMGTGVEEMVVNHGDAGVPGARYKRFLEIQGQLDFKDAAAML